MACTVYLDSVLVEISKGTTSILKQLGERSTASFTVVDNAGAGSYPRGTPVEIYDEALALIFSGFVDTPGKARMSPDGGLYHDISCMDNHYLADKRLVVKVYASQTLEYIVEDILTDYLAAEGITEGLIQTGPVIQSAVFNYVKASEGFDALAELSGMTWFIDDTKKLYFVDRATYTAPWHLDGTTHRAIKGSTYLSEGNSMYRNRQYVRGGKGLTSIQTEHFTGDGIIKSFALGYPLALEPDIWEDGNPMSVGIKGVETGKDYYWNKGDNTVYADTEPGVGVDVEIQYYGQYPLIALADNPGAQLARAAIEGGTGIVEEIATEAQHDSATAMQESASAKLIQYCREAEKYTYRTYESGLLPGQLQDITDSAFGFTSHPMLIQSVTVSTAEGYVTYEVTCITGPDAGSWTRFFSNILKRQDNQIAIGDSLLLVLLQQVETLPLSETTGLHYDSFWFGIVNRWIALPPAQGVGHNVEHELLTLAEVPTVTDHDTEDYHWDDADAFWGFATWG